MNIYDEAVKKTFEVLQGQPLRSYPYTPKAKWPMLESSDLIIGRQTSVELGTQGLKGLTYTMVTGNQALVCEDSIHLYGPDLKALKGQSVAYGKIVVFKVKDLAYDEAYLKIKALERAKFKVHPEGFMIRATLQENMECGRVSKKALKKGLSFETLGNLLIDAYKTFDFVEYVKVIFITQNEALLESLGPTAKGVSEITDAMNHIFDDIDLDCHTCTLKAVCDEVEGLREAHKSKVDAYKR